MTTIDNIKNLVQDDMIAMDAVIQKQLKLHIDVIRDMSSHLIKSGGKRLRPLLVILGARAFGYDGDAHIDLATSVEFFHTATLLHDDVVDESHLRRGKKTANDIWGSKASVLVGDFLFTRSFQMMVNVGNHDVITVLINAANTITKGEVLQLINCNNPKTTQEQYMEVIKDKTAMLFSASAQLGAILTEQPKATIQAMADYGLHLGNAFQLVDDALDYCADSNELGKNIGDDLAEGKPTLPLIHALANGTEGQQDAIKQAIKTGNTEQFTLIQQALDNTKAFDYTYQKAQQEIDHALTALCALDESPYKTALQNLAQFAIERRF